MAIPLSDLHVPSELMYPSTENADSRPNLARGWSTQNDRNDARLLPIPRRAFSVPLDAKQLAYLDRTPLPALPLLPRLRRRCTQLTDKLLSYIPLRLLSGILHVMAESFRIISAVVAFVGRVALKVARWSFSSKHITP